VLSARSGKLTTTTATGQAVTGLPPSNFSHPGHGTERSSRLTDIVVTQAPPANPFEKFIRHSRTPPAFSMPTEERPKRPHFWWREEQARLLALKRQLETERNRPEQIFEARVRIEEIELSDFKIVLLSRLL